MSSGTPCLEGTAKLQKAFKHGGEAFDANHALDCKNGGLVHQRHNEMRNENCDLNKKSRIVSSAL